MSKTIITTTKVTTETPAKKYGTKKIPNFWVEVIAFVALLVIAFCVGYLILNFSSLVEFRELS